MMPELAMQMEMKMMISLFYKIMNSSICMLNNQIATFKNNNTFHQAMRMIMPSMVRSITIKNKDNSKLIRVLESKKRISQTSREFITMITNRNFLTKKQVHISSTQIYTDDSQECLNKDKSMSNSNNNTGICSCNKKLVSNNNRKRNKFWNRLAQKRKSLAAVLQITLMLYNKMMKRL